MNKAKSWLLADRRILLCAIIAFLGFGVVISRLFGLQILRHDQYAARADAEQMRQGVIPARRGEIYALENGTIVPLVLNRPVYEVFVDPLLISKAGNQTRVLEALQNVPAEPRQPIVDALAQTTTQYQVVYRGLSRADAEALKALSLPGVGFKETTQRDYIEDDLAAQTLGFVNGEGAGQYGIEGALDSRLKGTDGLLRAVTDVNNVPLSVDRANIRTPAENGADIVLTLNPAIQRRAEQVVAAGAARAGAGYANIIVANPYTGEIYAMANYPSFDPANYGAAKLSDFANPILTDAYEAGSVIKTFIMAAVLEQGVATPNDTYRNVYTRMIDGWPVSSFQRYRVDEVITYQEAMDKSLNTGMIALLEELGGGTLGAAGRETLYDFYYNHFRLGRRVDFPLGNAAGAIVSPAQAAGINAQYATMTFGQGMTTTMLQVTAAFSATINGGYYIAPQIVAGTRSADGRLVPEPAPAREPILSESTSAAMRRVLENIRASAFNFNVSQWPIYNDPLLPYTAGGKTGTAQVPVAGGYHPTWTIGSYIGYAGGDKPEVVVMTRIGGEAYYRAADATWMFNEIVPWLLDYLQITPKG
jgi:cell division protein FtsI/penicillin-binding protein 2